MPITINGSGTLTGISAGGYPDGSVTDADLASTLDFSGKTINNWPIASGLFSAYAKLEDQKSNGTAAGQNTTPSAWRVRDLNTEVFDPSNIVTLSSNRFTLQAGSYLIVYRVPQYRPDKLRAALYNYTDSSYAGYSENVYGHSSYFQQLYVEGKTRVTIASAKEFEIRHWSNVQVNSEDLGRPLSISGVPEIYTTVEIYKEN
tara:strand:- start:834 stop:1439 length:606 start_codon:yes stop_codon:yes gene_type:complete